MKPDPARRKDGCCSVCGEPIAHKPRHGLNPQYYLSDPFCSSRCAREWHGTSLPVGDGSRGSSPTQTL
jgi:hypothetical protein